MNLIFRDAPDTGTGTDFDGILPAGYLVNHLKAGYRISGRIFNST
jgi:hypothetical protein